MNDLKPTFPPLPDGARLEIMWRVAVTSAIEDQGNTWEIFARLLYHHLTGVYEHDRLLQAKDER